MSKYNLIRRANLIFDIFSSLWSISVHRPAPFAGQPGEAETADPPHFGSAEVLARPGFLTPTVANETSKYFNKF